jgi:hypothetical protein
MKLLEEPQQPPDADARMKMTMNEHRPGTRPEHLRPWIKARWRHASQEHKLDPLSNQPLHPQQSKHP